MIKEAARNHTITINLGNFVAMSVGTYQIVLFLDDKRYVRDFHVKT